MKECNLKVCNAECCGIVPIPDIMIEVQKGKLNGECEITPSGYPSTSFVLKKGTVQCGFLDSNFKCSIYEYRPGVCRDFGSGKDHIMLKCRYLGQITAEESDRAVDRFLDNMGVSI